MWGFGALSLAGISISNIAVGNKSIELGTMFKPWFVIIILIITVILEFIYLYLDKTLT